MKIEDLAGTIKNGFKIIKDFGIIRKESGKGTRYVIAICKRCGKEWKVNYYIMNRLGGCSCNIPKKTKPLPDIINGFRIIEDYGYTKNAKVRCALVECKVCKNNYEVDPTKLKHRFHCGCIKNGKVLSKYSGLNRRLVNIHQKMIGRCHNEKSQDYYNYGARGIEVCSKWRDHFDPFYEWSIDNGYSDELSIDRIDNNLGYFPENCRWSSPTTQARNSRRVKMSLEGARAIRKRYVENPCYSTEKTLAEEYNVSNATIYAITRNRIWKE